MLQTVSRLLIIAEVRVPSQIQICSVQSGTATGVSLHCVGFFPASTIRPVFHTCLHQHVSLTGISDRNLGTY